MLAWARANVQGLAELRDPSAPDFTSIGRGRPTVTLFAPESLFTHDSDSTPGRCRPVTFAVEPTELSAEVPFDRGHGVPRLATAGRFEELIVGERVSVYGVHERAIHRNERGQQVEQIQASPMVSRPGHMLLEVAADEIRYGGVLVRAQIQCAFVETRPCIADDGTPGEASRCTKLRVVRKSLSSGALFGHPGQLRIRLGRPAGKPLPTCRGLPEDNLSGAIEPINHLLAGRRLLSPVATPWPVLSRSLGPCERAEQAMSAH